MEIHESRSEPWRITLVDTGDNTLTGGRLKRVREHLGDEDFCFTYGDGVGDVNITELIRFHKEQKVLCTLTATKPPGRFGALAIGKDETKISSFREKPTAMREWINGGFSSSIPRPRPDEATRPWERERSAVANDGQSGLCTQVSGSDGRCTTRTIRKLWSTGQSTGKLK